MWLEKIWLLLIVCWVIALGAWIFFGNKKEGNKIWSWSGLLFGVFTIIVALPILLPFINRTQVHSRRYTIDNNLKQWGLVFKMYANESPGGLFPPLTQQDGLWVPDLHVLNPEYLRDTRLVCDPDHQTATTRKMFEETFYQDPGEGTIDLDKTTLLMAENYVYPSWVVRNDADVEVMKRYRNEKEVHIGDIESEDAHLLWMRDGVEDAFITDINNPQAGAVAQSTIPVMIARPRLERPYRSDNVSRRWFNFKKDYLGWQPATVVPTLFLDGHVENIPLDELPDHIKALTELFPKPLEE